MFRKKILLILMILFLSGFFFGTTQNFEKTGYKFDGITHNINTWYLHTNASADRKFVWIVNNGVNNDLATGVVYVSIQEGGTVETAAVTVATILPLGAGDSMTISIRDNIRISVQGDTTNLNCLIYEYDAIEAVTLKSDFE